MVRRNGDSCALVIDDEPDILSLYELSLERVGVRVVAAASLAEAMQALKEPARFNFCITDLRLPDGNGLELVRHIQHRALELPVAVVTAYGDVQAAVEALKAGAFDFVTKPLSPGRLREIVDHALRLAPGGVMADQATQGKPAQDPLIGTSPPMQALRRLIGKVARTQAPVFIHGESGTGKELIARLIHQQGPRAGNPFVPVNCGAIPSELIESELFGHRKGSFTGASADKPGLFRAAHGGTLFLDEVAELPLAVQVKLLRVLQERAVRPVGAVEEAHVDVRVLSASHKDLSALVQAGQFRHDLYYRLNVIQVDVPPLRDRVEDIPALASGILQRLALRDGSPALTLTQDAMAALQTHTFRGNVRELENLLERSVALADGLELGVNDLFLAQQATKPQGSLDPAGEPDMAAGEPSPRTILKVLEAHRWNRTRAAEALGMTLRQLRYRLGKMNVEKGDELSMFDNRLS